MDNRGKTDKGGKSMEPVVYLTLFGGGLMAAIVLLAFLEKTENPHPKQLSKNAPHKQRVL